MKSVVISALIAVMALCSTASAEVYADSFLNGIISYVATGADPSLSTLIAMLNNEAVASDPAIKPIIAAASNATTSDLTLLAPSDLSLANVLAALGMSSPVELVAPTLFANRDSRSLLADILSIHLLDGVLGPDALLGPDLAISTNLGSVSLSTVADSLTLTAAASNGFAVSATSVINPGGVTVANITTNGNSTGTSKALIHIVNTVLVPTTLKINLAGFDFDGNFSSSKDFLDSSPNIAAYAQTPIEPLSPQFKGAVFIPDNEAVAAAVAALSGANLTVFEVEGVLKAVFRGHSITAYPNATGTSGEVAIDYTSYLTIGGTTQSINVKFNNTEPYMIEAIVSGLETVSANVYKATYGPTIVNGAMVYYVDKVFTSFVVANLATIKEDANRAARRNLDKSVKGFPLTAAELTALGFAGDTNPLSAGFSGCFFQPNTDQLSAVAKILDPSLTNATIAVIAELASKAIDDESLRTLLKCAVGSFIVPSSSLAGTSLDVACDNISGDVLNLKTECPNALLTIGTTTTDNLLASGLVYVSKLTLTDPSDKRRRLLEINNNGPVKGEAEGVSSKSTFFYQDSNSFVASPAITKQIDDYNGALGLVPSILVVALSVLCAFSL